MRQRSDSAYPEGHNMLKMDQKNKSYFNIFLGFLLLNALANLVFAQQGEDIFKNLHLLFDTANATLSIMLALFLLVEQYNIETHTRKYFVIAFSASAFVETLHSMVGIEWSGYFAWISEYAHTLRPATWPAATYLLPFAVLWMLYLKQRNILLRPALFAAGIIIATIALLGLSLLFKPYIDSGILGIQRPTQIPVVILWALVIALCWRMRRLHPYYDGLMWMGALLLLSDVFMLYSTSPHEKLAMMAHVGKFLAYVFFHIVQMKISVQNSDARKASELELRENEQRFRYILDTCPTAVRIAKSGGHQVIYFNESYSKLIDATADEMAGIDPAKYYANPAEYADIVSRLGKGEQILERLIELHIPDKPETGSKWTLATYLPIQYQGSPVILGWFHDITERIRVDRMKSEFVSTVSHELRTPLTSINGALGLLAGGALGALPEQAKHMVDVAHKNTQRLAFMINDLLDMEKLVAGKMVFDMQTEALLPLLEQTIECNRNYGASRHVTLKLVHPAPDVWVTLDKQRLLQIMANLVSNAIKYSPDHGTVELAILRNAKRVRISVIDHGPGIPAEFHARIFQKFSQADSSDTRQKGGTGLGLAITKELVERMGGEIGFDSVEGQGATFYVEFPVMVNNVDPSR